VAEPPETVRFNTPNSTKRLGSGTGPAFSAMKLVTVEQLRQRPGRGIVVPVVKADRPHEEGGRSCQGLGLTSSKRMAEGG
jgi:hypothetical protein